MEGEHASEIYQTRCGRSHARPRRHCASMGRKVTSETLGRVCAGRGTAMRVSLAWGKVVRDEAEARNSSTKAPRPQRWPHEGVEEYFWTQSVFLRDRITTKAGETAGCPDCRVTLHFWGVKEASQAVIRSCSRAMMNRYSYCHQGLADNRCS